MVAIFCICNNLFSQQTYFQQEVNYKINVQLNDENHTLKAFEEIEYINNSSTSIKYIYFHLWPNAYKNQSTALAKQLISRKNLSLFYSKEEERGYIDSLDFKVDGKSVKVEYDAENIDICKIILNEPLRSLDTLKITTPFFVKIPDAKFSRLGHNQQAYYITQWYPKPAVFDKDGWHPMPYLDQGEFYSEFGSFDVTISLPKNYVLAATGDMEDDDAEIDFLNNKVVETLERIEQKKYGGSIAFPPSSSLIKTLNFKQYRVHDFAWFADKRFNVLHDQIELPNTKKTIDTWVYFTNNQFELWKDALDYVNESTIFYSYLIGDYPYNNVSAVDGVIMAGGGMEYPNVTVIGEVDNAFQLDITIAHEVGHNWFYGILGSNERDFPFMDEGMNSLYEIRYNRAKYPHVKLGETIGIDTAINVFGVNKIPYWREHEISYFMSAAANMHQPVITNSKEFSSFNYGAIVYGKAAILFDYLRDYLTDDVFDKAMKFYFEKYKFKHPQPQDLLQTLQYFSGNDLSWFEKELLQTNNKIDYKIKRVKRNSDGSYSIKAKNKTGVAVPVNLYGFKNGKPAGMVWFKGFEKKNVLDFPPSDIDYFKLDGFDYMPDINRKNNSSRTKGLFKKTNPVRFNFITSVNESKVNNINYFPIIGYNMYNGFMAGLTLHNYSIFDKKFDYVLAPMYSFNSRNVAGFAKLNYNFYPKNIFRVISIGSSYKMFEEDEVNFANGFNQSDFRFLNYKKLTPFINFELKNSDANSSIQQSFYIQSHFIQRNSVVYNSVVTGSITNFFSTIQSSTLAIHELNYLFQNTRIINPFSFQTNVQSDGKMAKISFLFKEKINVLKKKFIDLRFFAGFFLAGTDLERGPYRFRLSGFNGHHDYLYEGNFIGRNMNTGFANSQFLENDGAMKIWTPLGQSADFLLSANIKSPTIWKFPLKVFLDIGTAGSNSMLKEKLLWDAGINFTIVNNIVEVYIPLLYSNDIKQTLTLNNYNFANTIRFTFNLQYIKPKEFIRENFN